MSNFTFNNHEEFGLFLKINSSELKNQTLDEAKRKKIDETLKFFANGKGGCPCNYEKRLAAAKKSYTDFVPLFFTDNEAAVNFVKAGVGTTTNLEFKSDSQDETPFFQI